MAYLQLRKEGISIPARAIIERNVLRKSEDIVPCSSKSIIYVIECDKEYCQKKYLIKNSMREFSNTKDMQGMKYNQGQ